jgi:hypothetical protein
MSKKEAEKSVAPAAPAPSEEQLHPAPSMLWVVIPLGLIAVYAFLSR